MSTFVDQQEYVVINCGAEEHGGAFMFAVTREFYDWTRKGNGWHCPMGHSRRWLSDSPEQKLRKAEARETALRDQLEASIRDAEQARSMHARDRQRVMGARSAMPTPWFVLCGSMFDRPIPRHRVFATSFYALNPEHPECRGLAKRSSEELGWEYRDMSVTGKGRRAGTSERWAYLLGTDWPMTQHEMAESIPPAYTEHIGRELMAHMESEMAA